MAGVKLMIIIAEKHDICKEYAVIGMLVLGPWHAPGTPFLAGR